MKKTFAVSGMHCASCELVIGDAVREYRPNLEPTVSLKNQTLTVEVNENENPEELEKALAEPLEKFGYALGSKSSAPVDRIGAFLLAVVVLGVFALLQKTGVFNGISLAEMNYVTAFIVGVIASFSTCLVVVGGFVLALSAEASSLGVRARSLTFFHLSRLISFALFGGILGLLSKSIQVSTMSTVVMQIIVSLVLLLLGLNLLGLTTKFVKLPSGIKRAIDRSRIASGSFAPIVLGAATFFLPCGFTQSMQLYTLTTGSFATGALTMLAFALGTLPMLLFLSYGGYQLLKSKRKAFFYQFIGFVIIFLALFTLVSSVRLFFL